MGVLLGLVLASQPAAALRLGPATAMSAVGEPLRLEIAISGWSEAQSSALRVGLAPMEAYRASAMDYADVLEGAEVVLSRREDGQPVLRVSSTRAARQSYLDLIVEAKWPAGRLERQYTVLLEAGPASSVAETSAAAAGTVASANAAASARPRAVEATKTAVATAPVAPVVSAAAAAPVVPAVPATAAAPDAAAVAPRPKAKTLQSGSGLRHTVKPGETLLGIARRLQRPGVSTAEILEALLLANPKAFVGGDINRLRSGATLVFPDPATGPENPAATAGAAMGADAASPAARNDAGAIVPRPDPAPVAAMPQGSALPAGAVALMAPPAQRPASQAQPPSAPSATDSAGAPAASAMADRSAGARQMSAGVEPAAHDPAVFKPDPSYAGERYDPQQQIAIYGGKRDVPEPRPLIELGRPLYLEGPLPPSSDVLGTLNPVNPSLLVYGDWRTALASNGNGRRQTNQLATRLNLEVDWSLTSTERVHALFRPLDRDGRFTRHAFSGPQPRRELLLDGQVETLFLEGDLGQIAAGLTGRYSLFDLPFSLGLMPLHLHSGVWMDDAIAGIAVARAGRHSRALGISHLDATVFVGLDRVSSPALREPSGALNDRHTRMVGAALFLDATEGYWEIGLGHVDGRQEIQGLGYSSAAVSFTRRYGAWLSSSMRVIGAFGQNPQAGRARTADGFVVLLENSMITSRPLTLVPYFNAFAGFGRPQSLARDPDAGGLLRNTGILFESDGLTGFPTLDATAHDTWGAAIGLQYLFELDRQVVVEVAGLDLRKRVVDPTRASAGAQYGAGFRFQQPLSRSLLFRADAIAAWRKNADRLLGVRSELRLKF
jgi:hypothetical protein